MKFKLNEIRGRLADQGNTLSWNEISEATGIGKQALITMARGDFRQIRPEYIDALCQYFKVDPSGLIQPEPVDLPLSLEIRPDRHGVPIKKGGKTE